MPEVKTTTKESRTVISGDGGSSVKTTTKSEDSHSNAYGLSNLNANMDSDYRSSISARQGFQGRSQMSQMSPGGGRVLKIVTEMGSHSVSGFSPAFSQGAASAILESREREKKRNARFE